MKATKQEYRISSGQSINMLTVFFEGLGIAHTTIQIEDPKVREAEARRGYEDFKPLGAWPPDRRHSRS